MDTQYVYNKVKKQINTFTKRHQENQRPENKFKTKIALKYICNFSMNKMSPQRHKIYFFWPTPNESAQGLGLYT